MKIPFACAILLSLVAFNACKKSGGDPPAADFDQGLGRCRLASVRTLYNGMSSYQTIHYDEAGRKIYAVVQDSAGAHRIDSFGYFPGFVVSYANFDNTIYYSDTISLDDQNRILKIGYQGSVSFPRGHTYYYYDPNGTLSQKKLVPDAGSAYNISYYCTWSGGNMVKDSDNAGNVRIYNYDTGRPWQIAAARTYYVSGVKLSNSKHLLTSVEYHNKHVPVTMQTFRYGFDAQGRIVSDTNENGTEIHEYGYECR